VVFGTIVVAVLGTVLGAVPGVVLTAQKFVTVLSFLAALGYLAAHGCLAALGFLAVFVKLSRILENRRHDIRHRQIVCPIIAVTILLNRRLNKPALKFQNCPGRYIGRTGRKFKTRYKEHIQDIRKQQIKTGFSHHILNTGHSYNNIENTLKILNIQDKGPYLNTRKIPYTTVELL
jgi:hypothetical protein